MKRFKTRQKKLNDMENDKKAPKTMKPVGS